MTKLNKTTGQMTILNITQKIKDKAIRTRLKTQVNSNTLEGVSSSCSASGTCRITFVTNPV